MVPDAQSEIHTPLVRHPDDSVQRIEIAPLLVFGDSHHFDIGKFFKVKEIGIRRRKIPPVLIAKKQCERIEAIPG